MSNFAQSIAQTMQDQYDDHRDDHRYSIWGFAMYWDHKTNAFLENPEGPWKRFVYQLEEAVKDSGKPLIKPKLFVPSEHDPMLHTSLLFSRNLTNVASRYCEMVPDAPKEIFDDSKIMNESAMSYLHQMDKGDMPENTTYLKFLCSYESGEQYDRKNEMGTYRALLDRSLIRFESAHSLIGAMQRVADFDLFDLVNLHNSDALEQRATKINPEAAAVYKQYSHRNDNPEGVSTQQVVSCRSIFGKRRVKINNPNKPIDLEAYATRIQGLSPVNFDPNIVIEQQVSNALLDEVVNLYGQDTAAAINDLNQRQFQTDIERRAAEHVQEMLSLAAKVQDYDSIHHKMTINRKG